MLWLISESNTIWWSFTSRYLSVIFTGALLERINLDLHHLEKSATSSLETVNYILEGIGLGHWARDYFHLWFLRRQACHTNYEGEDQKNRWKKNTNDNKRWCKPWVQWCTVQYIKEKAGDCLCSQTASIYVITMLDFKPQATQLSNWIIVTLGIM